MEHKTPPQDEDYRAPAEHAGLFPAAAELAMRLPGVADAHDAALEGMVARASLTDPEGPDHPRRVGLIAAILAEEFGLSAPERAMLARAAALHDIGKLALPPGVLGHSEGLTEEARRQMERHTLLGASLLAHARAPWMRLAGVIALTHHERWDGKGYPFGLEGEQIPLAGRLVAVADVYDALRSSRPYKTAQSHAEALRRILQGDERVEPTQFDPRVLAALQRRAADIRAVRRRAVGP